MSEGLGECCISGHLHAGTPKGTITEIAGLKTYVTKPANGSKDMTILYISDIFGYELPVRYNPPPLSQTLKYANRMRNF